MSTSALRSTLLTLAALPLAVVSLSAQAQTCAALGGEMPLKYTGGATVPAISACDLMTRLYIYADDSMMGRRVGTADNIRATDYIEREVRKLGLVPAGDNGTFFQEIGLFSRRTLASSSTITVGGQRFEAGKDFTANFPSATKSMANVGVIYGGVAGDTLNVLSPEQVRGKILVLSPSAAPTGGRGAFGGRGMAGGGGAARQAVTRMQAAAAMVVTAVGDQLPTPAGPGGRGGFGGGTQPIFIEFDSDTMPGTIQITTPLATALFGKPLADVAKGTAGNAATLSLTMDQVKLPARNVVAMLPGSDPVLRNEYILISAHNDHTGFTQRPMADHDSIKVFLQHFRPQGADDRTPAATIAERIAAGADAFKKSLDSIRALRPTPRADSIYNGADDDGSGSMTVLEIAEMFALGAEKPKRSVLFVWQTGEESGMWGSGWYAAHPTVDRTKIVANINMDMVGRAWDFDATGSEVAPNAAGVLIDTGKLLKGGPGYLQLVGSRRLSKEFGDLVETVNVEQKLGFKFDYAIDANGHPQNIYCRSDHWSYAKWGIPTVFMTTGGHADYHQLTDEPQYINYRHMAEIGKLSYALTMRVANLDHRVKVDLPGPFDPMATCRQ